MFRSLLTVLILTFIAMAPRVADARPRTDEARQLVTQHFEALARGDSDAVRALWTRDAGVTTADGGGNVKTETLAVALERWVAHHEGLTWKVVGVKPRRGGTFDIHVEVTWNGMRFRDRLGIRPDRKGALRLFRKHSAPHQREPRHSHY